MRLSVVIPVFNCAPWLKACLDSIAVALELAKSTGDEGRNIEIEVICIDDCSTDGSSVILDTAAAAFGGTLVVRHLPQNGGVAAARNAGLELATGDYLWFVDGDDIVAPESFAVIVEMVERFENPDLVHFDLARFTDEVDFATQSASPRYFDLTRCVDRRIAYRRHAPWILGSSAVFRRAAFGQMRFMALKNGEDSIWGRRCFYRAASLVRVPRELYGYRQRETSANNLWTSRHWREFCFSSWVMFKEGLCERGLLDLVLIDGVRSLYHMWLWRKKVR